MKAQAGTYLGGEVLEDGGAVDSSGGSHSPVAGGASLQVSVDPAHRELGVGATDTSLTPTAPHAFA